MLLVILTLLPLELVISSLVYHFSRRYDELILLHVYRVVHSSTPLHLLNQDFLIVLRSELVFYVLIDELCI